MNHIFVVKNQWQSSKKKLANWQIENICQQEPKLSNTQTKSIVFDYSGIFHTLSWKWLKTLTLLLI